MRVADGDFGSPLPIRRIGLDAAPESSEGDLGAFVTPSSRLAIEIEQIEIRNNMQVWWRTRRAAGSVLVILFGERAVKGHKWPPCERDSQWQCPIRMEEIGQDQTVAIGNPIAPPVLLDAERRG